MDEVGLSGLAAISRAGRGADALLAGTLAGASAFGPVQRFSVAAHRVTVAATLPSAGSLGDELAGVIDDACGQAGLTGSARAGTALFLAVHAYPDAPRVSVQRWRTAAELGAELAGTVGLDPRAKVYTSACVSASTAVSDAAALISTGRAERIVVAAGYLVESDQFALFDAGRTLATDGVVRPFSAGRTGLLLGDAVAAVVLEPVSAIRQRARRELAPVARCGAAREPFHPLS